MSKVGNRGVIGQPIKRKEDQRLITGKGIFVDDIVLPEMLHASFVRSPYGHAYVKRIDASRALGLPGVVDVVTGEEFAKFVRPQKAHSGLDSPTARALEDYGIAVKKAIYHGEAVAAVVALDKYTAKDAVELVEVDYDPLPPLVDAEESMSDGAVKIHDGTPTNVVWHKTYNYGDVDKAFSKADLIVKSRLYFDRFMAAPLETYVIIASFDRGQEVMTVYCNSAHPGRDVFLVAGALNLSPNRVRLICQDNGGSFGNKNNIYPYTALIGYLAMKTGRPVKWVMDRNEHLLASGHGNEMIYYGEIAVKKDGTILGIKARLIADEGSELRSEPRGAMVWIRQLTTFYRFRHLRMEVNAVLTNKCPTGSMRAYGKVQHCFLIESLIEKAARQLRLDPAEIRFKNFILPKEMPYKNPAGNIYDGGDYPGCLRRTLEMVGYEDWRKKQQKLRREGKCLGIGIAMAMESQGGNLAPLWKKGHKSSGSVGSAMIRIDADGNISASVDSMSMGHSHQTTTAQIVADVLSVSPDDVDVFAGFDSWITAFGERYSGSYASRFSTVHHGAIFGAAKRMREKILRHGAFLLGSAVNKVELVQDGKVRVKGTKKSAGLKEVASNAWLNTGVLPKDLEAGLVVHYVYKAPLKPLESAELGKGNFSLTYAYGGAAAVVEVDPGTGMVKLLKIVLVDDPGRCINPMVCEGQVHGQIGHQVGAALYERLLYDKTDGRLLTSTFKDYLLPTAADFPTLETAIMETPSLFSPLGARGMAEGGGVPQIAVINAVRDALSPLGIEIDSSHIEPEEILRRIQERTDR
ncbi:MAG: xanthine dehydrogenase family protein molybdopterin-binding subunit [Deltaproteobacteria bacterium]|nr:xanthine dehydrogenase family protein molybdopterin-binding subunit [Deltaproteobacteria bacterium]